MKIGRKFLLIVLVGVAAFAALSILSLREQRQAAEDAFKARNRSVVEVTLSVLRQFEARRESGEFDLAEAQKAAKDMLRNVRYDHGEYIFIANADGKILMHPSRPDLEDPKISGLRDDAGRDLSSMLVQAARGDGEVRYTFTRIDGGKPLEKMSYIGRFEPWGWLVGTGVYLEDAQSQFNSLALRYAYSAAPIALLLLLVSAHLARSVSTPLVDLSNALELIRQRKFGQTVPHQDRTDELGGFARALEELRRLENVEAEVNRSRELVAKVFDVSQEAVLVTDADGVIVQAGAAMCRLSGYRQDELLGKKASILNSGHHDKAFFADMWDSLSRAGEWSGEVWNRRACGEIFVVQQKMSAIYGDDGELLYYVAVMRDVSDNVKRRPIQHYMPHHDPLTNLSDAVLFRQQADKALAAAARSGRSAAMVVLDVDRFADINSELGMVGGDEVLQMISLRLLKTLRSTDLIARLCEDSFAVLMVDYAGPEELLIAATRLMETLRQPVVVSGLQAAVTVSVGIAPAEGACKADSLLAEATAKAAQASGQGGNQIAA